VVAMAHAMAGFDARTIGYVEAHGTATPMGDSIECAALTKAFRTSTDENNFCALGSVKSNVGHLDAASGVAALIKTALSLEHRMIPASINFTRPNPKIDFPSSPFYVNTELQPWPSGKSPRRAGVHSFGIGGTNAHIVLEEVPARESCPSLRSHHLLLFSARSKSALQAATANFASHLRDHPDLNLADLAYTCQVGRREFAQRQILVAKDPEDAARALAAVDDRRVRRATKAPTERSVVFLFPGRGAAYANMGLELYGSEPAFRKHVDRCSELLNAHLRFDLRSALYPTDAQRGDSGPDLVKVEVSTLATFVVEYALAQLWMEWGVQPEAMMGQEVGEFVAACVAEVFSVGEALWLLAEQCGVEPGEPKISLKPPKIPFVSNVTGTWVTASEATDPNYWNLQLRRNEGSTKGIDCLMGASNRTFLEVGPGLTFAKAMQEHPAAVSGHVIFSSLAGMDEHASETESMLHALGQLWLYGSKIDWTGFWRHEERRRIPLPTYAFDRKRHWVDAQPHLSYGEVTSRPAPEAALRGVGASPGGASSSADTVDFSVPTDDVEAGVAEIWQRLLGVERVGIYDNFFALGGHSMLGAQLLALLRAAFHVDIPLPSLFEQPTVAGMAERVRAFR